MVIRQLHGCDSTWERSESVTETLQGKAVWDGEVEVFLVTHPKANCCYAWSDAGGNFTAVLGIPPATDPQNAVKVSIVVAAKKGNK